MLLLLLSLLILSGLAALIILIFKRFVLVKPEDMSKAYDKMDEYDKAIHTKHPAANLRSYDPFIAVSSVLMVSIWFYIMIEWKTYDEVPVEIEEIANVQDQSIDVPVTDPPPPEPVQQNKPKKMEVVEELEVDTAEVEDLTQKFELPDEEEEEEVEEEEEEVYIPPTVNKAEDPAQFPGGKAAFKKFISDNFHVCDDALNANKKGMIMTNFVVDEYGRVTNVAVERGVFPCLDQEAIRVLQMSPRWTPGKVNGRPVRERHKFPVVIRYN